MRLEPTRMPSVSAVEVVERMAIAPALRTFEEMRSDIERDSRWPEEHITPSEPSPTTCGFPSGVGAQRSRLSVTLCAMPSATAPRVFLSYGRKDGEKFATDLRRRLQIEEPEITIWHDRAQMEGGIGWWAQIEAALDQVTFLVIVMTPAAMASEITRKEWRYARQHGVNVYPVKAVPESELDYGSLPNWMRKAHFFDLAKEWDTFVNHLKSDRHPVRVPFMAPDLPSGFVPREREFGELLRLLLDRDRMQPVAITTALQGAGGYGKTTLAIALCHDERIVEAFDDGVLWTSLGQSARVVDELARMYEALTGLQTSFVDVAQASAKVAEKLEHRDCLMVVDDVWDGAHLQPFLRGGPHCARLVTTRRFDLVTGAERVRVDEMSTAESTRLLGTAFTSDIESDERLAPLARRLGEWPLLLKLAAGMLRRRIERGDSADGALEYVNRALSTRGVTAFDRRDATQRDQAVRHTVEASLDLISAEDRRRFGELAIFPEETAIPLTTLERLWDLGELDAVDCAQRLDDLTLLSLDLRRRVVSLHDVMRAYLLRELGGLARVHAQLVAGYGEPLELPDDYAWRWLPYHMVQAGQVDHLRALLLRPEWLQSKIGAVGPHALIQDFDLVRGDSDLEMVQATLRLAVPGVAADGDQLCEQLISRLPSRFSARLEAFKGELTRTAPRPRLHVRWPNLHTPGGGLVQTLPGHSDPVNGALLLPDGGALSWSGDGTLRLWNLAAGNGRALSGHEDVVNGALLLTDGRALSWSRDNTLRLWDLAAGAGRALTGHRDSVDGALLLPDGRALSWSADRTLRIWDASRGDSRALAGHESEVLGAALVSHERALSWSRDQTLRVWNIATAEDRVLAGHQEIVRDAIPLPDARALSWGDEPVLWIWNIDTGQGHPLIGHARTVRGALALPDGRALSWSEDHTLRIWNLATAVGRVLGADKAWIAGALLVAPGQALTWSSLAMRLWNLETSEARTISEKGCSAVGALLLPDGRALSWNSDGSLSVWNLVEGEERQLRGHDGCVNGARLLSDGRVLSWGGDGTLRVWDLTPTARRRLTDRVRSFWRADRRTRAAHAGPVWGASLLSARWGLSWSGDDTTLQTWDLATGKGRALVGHQRRLRGALRLSDGRALSWSDEHMLRVWNPATGRGNTLIGDESVSGACLLSDGRVLSWTFGGTLCVWDVVTGRSLVFPERNRTIAGALPLPDGRALSWGDEGSLRLWSFARHEVQTFVAHTRAVHGVLRLPDDRVVSWSSDGTLVLWDLAASEARALTQDYWCTGALSLPQGHLLSWSTDHNLRVWELATAKSSALAGHQAPVRGALLTSNGRAVSWSMDRTLRLWNLQTGDNRVLARDCVVKGALALPGNRVLSWTDDGSVRIHSSDRADRELAFYLDATPTVVIPYEPDRFLVGDALGRVHFLEIVHTS
jgi:WD40 repeat protein